MAENSNDVVIVSAVRSAVGKGKKDGALATVHPIELSARVMKDDRDYGSIAPGKVADLVIIDGRPAERIIDLRKVERVGGRLQNTVIHTFPSIGQFWTYKAEDFLKNPVYSRDYPPCTKC